MQYSNLIDEDILREYRHSFVKKKLELQTIFNQPVCAFTDVDDTLIRKSLNLEHSKRYMKATEKLVKRLNELSIPLVAVTARDLPCVIKGQSLDSERLPTFDIVASSIGTELWIRRESGEYIQDHQYEEIIHAKSKFDREEVYALLKEFKKQVRKQFPHSNLNFQERDNEKNIQIYKKNPLAKRFGLTNHEAPQDYKISMNLTGSFKEALEIKHLLKAFLQESNHPKIKVILSEGLNPNGPRFYNIDILAATKATAVSYLKQLLNCRAIVAGDSGNDIDMLTNEADVAIVVGGSKTELIEAVKKIPVERFVHPFNFIKAEESEDNFKLMYHETNDMYKGPESVMHALLRLETFMQFSFSPLPNIAS